MDTTLQTQPLALALLSGWLERNGIMQAHFAARVGITQSHLSKILSGHKGTSDALRVRIETESGGAVPYASWRPSITNGGAV